MLITQELLHEYLEQARLRYGIEVVEKTTSKFMRMLATLMFFNKTFLEGYVTTIGTKIYWPNMERMYMHPDTAFGVLFHEIQHGADFRKSPGFFVTTYLAPQIFFLGILMAILAVFLGNSWLLWLLAVLCLLPFPAVGRAIWEMRGTSCGTAMRIWDNIGISDAYVDAIVDRFTGPDYYYMLPSKKAVVWLFNRYKKKILDGNLTDTQKITYAFLKLHGKVTRGNG